MQSERVKSELRLSGDVVMKLASTLPAGQNYMVFADNFFTSLPLLVKVLERNSTPCACAKPQVSRGEWSNREWSKVTTSPLLMVHTQLTRLPGGTNPPSPSLK